MHLSFVPAGVPVLSQVPCVPVPFPQSATQALTECGAPAKISRRPRRCLPRSQFLGKVSRQFSFQEKPRVVFGHLCVAVASHVQQEVSDEFEKLEPEEDEDEEGWEEVVDEDDEEFELDEEYDEDAPEAYLENFDGDTDEFEIGADAPVVEELSDLPRAGRENDADELALAMQIAGIADDVKAVDIKILKTFDISYLTSYMVIVTAFSRAQVLAIMGKIEDKVERSVIRKEGEKGGGWVLVDYGSVILNIFLPKDRDYYNLDKLYRRAEVVPFDSTPSTPELDQDFSPRKPRYERVLRDPWAQ